MRALITGLATAFLIDAAMYSALTPLLPSMVDKYDLSKSAAGVLYSAYMVGSAVGAAAGAVVVRPFGRSRVTRLALVVMGVSILGFAVADHFVVALFFRTLSGLAGGLVWVAAMTWLFAASSVSRRGKTVGTVMSIAIFGTLVGPLIGNAAVAVGQVPVFMAVALISLVCAVFLPSDTTDEQPVERVTRPRRAQDLGTRRHILTGSIGVMVISSSLYGAFFVLVPLDLAASGSSGLEIGWLFAICSALSALTNRWTGKKVDARGMYWPTMISIAGGALLLLALALAESGWLIMSIMVLGIGFVLALGVTPISSTLSLDADGAGLPGPTTSMIMLVVFSGGEALGAMAAPSLAQVSSDSVVYLVLGVLSVVNLAVVWLCHRARGVVRAADRFAEPPHQPLVGP